MPRQILVVATAFVAVLLALGGCGSEDAETGSKSEDAETGSKNTTIAGQVKRYYAALASGNGEAACDVLTEQTAKGFEAVLNGPVSSDCKTNIETLSRASVLRGRPRVTRVRATRKQATAHVVFENPRLESDVLLVREGDVWLSQLPAILESAPGPPGFEAHGSVSRP